jgi:hypothetical protein
MSDDAVALAVEAYQELLAGNLTDPVEQALADRGVDLGALLRDEDRADDTITRADICELIGAASVVDHDGVPLDAIHLANVPKGQRNLSERGIDVLGAVLIDGGPEDELIDGEFVVVCSVKHTVSNPADMRAKLVASLRPTELSAPYLASQLRLLRDRASERGVDLRRVMLVLGAPRDSSILRVVGLGVAPVELTEESSTAVSGLRDAEYAEASYRVVHIPDLPRLHEAV